MDEDEKEAIEQITDKLNRDVELPPYGSSSGRGYSREYQKYKEEEVEQRSLTRYEKLCHFSSGILGLKAGESTRQSLSSPLRLLDWEMTPGMVLSASFVVGFAAFASWITLFVLNSLVGGIIPFSIMLIALLFPVGAGYYTYRKPVFEAKNKVIKSSGEMILSILYMVVYMRSSPNLEGAVRFAALNLDGPISKDLKQVLWKVEVGDYSDVSESLYDYTKVWKDYNQDYLQSLQMIEAAMNDPDEERQKTMLQDSLDSILEGTKEKMKHYAQSLKTPVMILNAMGAMLPVLGMIMLPLISVFMGGAISEMHLFMLFNIMLPFGLYWFMQRLLTSRPPTTSSEPVDQSYMPPRGRTSVGLLGRKLSIPAWWIGVVIFAVVGSYGIMGYLSFPHFYPIEQSTLDSLTVPGLYGGESGLAPIPMLLRSVSITLGLGLGIGATKLLGAKERKAAQDELKDIEEQFPRALFQLGNKISGGTPIELALEEAAEATKQLEISGLFRKASNNIRQLGMTFEQSLFNSTHGALRSYPSKTINTVMRAVLESSQKGTSMAAMTMLTISRYLQNIHETQERLNDLLDETTTTIVMLAYLLAPVVSGVAVGMSQTIMTAMFQLSQKFNNAQLGGSGQPSSTSSFGGIASNLDAAIAPELLQFVVGIYLIQLLYILGTFYMKITEGENKTYRDAFIGKVMLTGITFYTIVLVAVGVVFGGVVQSVATGIG